MWSALDISASALVAQRTRLNAISSNIANLSSAKRADGSDGPYQAKFVVFEEDESLGRRPGAAGVKVAAVETETAPPLLKLQPGHPLADERGYVAYPNINLSQEFVDALEAARAYEANLGVLEVTKSLGQQTLRILG